MKPPRNRESKRPDPRRKEAGTLPPPDEETREEEMPFDPAELADFLEADDSPVPVDPSFKMRLRNRLWKLFQLQAAGRRGRRKGSGRDPAPRAPAPPVARPKRDD